MENKKNILLILIIFVQIAVCTVFFAFFRQGYHSDETWSFGLANSIGQPHFVVRNGIYLDYMTIDDFVNFNTWITGKTCNDYLTVQKGEQFDLFGVYKNMSLDHHPFLFFWLVNIVCSFFPDSFSYWYVFILQLVFLAITQIFLFKTGKIVLPEKKWSPLILCLFYAVGRGGMVTFSFIRQYSLLTMFVIMHFYYQMKLLNSKDFDIKKIMFPVAFTGLLGLLTHYYMVAVSFGLTLVICIYLLFRKKIKKMLAYGFSMVGMIVAFVLIWPYAIRNLMTGNGSYKFFPLETQIKISFSDTLKSVCGLEIDPMRSATYSYIIAFIVLFSAVAAPLCFLFRNEDWFHSFLERAKKTMGSVFGSLKNDHLYVVTYSAIFFVAIVYLIVLSYTVDIFRMGESYTRYTFALMPLLCILVLGIIELCTYRIPYVKKWLPIIILCLSVSGAVYSQVQPNYYIVEQPGNMTMDEAADFFEGKDIQFLTSHDFVTLYTTNVFRKSNNIRIFLYDWYKRHTFEEFDPHKDDFYYIISDWTHSTGDPAEISENIADLDQLAKMPIDPKSKAQIKIDFADDVTEDQKQQIINNIIKADVIPIDEQNEILKGFNSNGYHTQWVDDMEFNGLLLKIFHVTRTSPQPAAETK